eukprot:CAMPEP_0117518108 /NCGR_PEP_ID=MMETSP0784-20121206/31962_1 /TAXON_ID=39447 /ORGANISM="" /LENGTH=43 /DNA_ID= /DNA_START= /DNA_END= /DNA_ORIENTATION=
MALALRRYMLALDDLRNTILATVCNAVLELAVNFGSTAVAVLG